MGRKMLICREISKYYEEYIRLDIDRLKTINASVSQAIAAHDTVAFIKKNLTSLMMAKSTLIFFPIEDGSISI